MNQEIQKTEGTKALSNPAQQIEPGVLKTDIIVPYLCVAQGLSEAVKERKVQMGDIYRSTTCEILGSPDKPVEVVFLGVPQTRWIIEQRPQGQQRFQWRATMPRTAKNELDQWYYWADKDLKEVSEGTPGAIETRRVKQLLVFAVLPSDIAAAEAEMKKAESGELPDPNKALTPVLLSFRSTSYRAGQDVVNLYSQSKSLKTPIWRYMLPISCKLEQNDQGSFYVWSVDRTKTKGVPKEQLPLIEEWASMLSSGVANIEIHEEGESSSYGDAPPAREVSSEVKADIC